MLRVERRKAITTVPPSGPMTMIGNMGREGDVRFVSPEDLGIAFER